MNTTIYKICDAEDRAAADADGRYRGSAVDHADGLIHLSSAGQLAVDAGRPGDAIRWAPSRGGALFPDLYWALPLSAVSSVAGLTLGPDSRHVLPTR